MRSTIARRLAICALAAAAWLGCGHRSSSGPTAHQDQADYLADAAAFTNNTQADAGALMRKAGAVVTDEWQLWEHRGPMTPAKYKQLYRQSQAYVFELGDWHLWNADKRKSDLALVDQLRDAHPQHVLVFGSGAPLLAIPLARAGLDVTIGDVDSNMLRFGAFRAERRGVHVKSWRAGVNPAPPEPSYDAIIVLDMLEHLPREELAGIVDQLIALKTPKTQIIAEAPGGKTWLHAALDDASRQQLQRLQTGLPGR